MPMEMSALCSHVAIETTAVKTAKSPRAMRTATMKETKLRRYKSHRYWTQLKEMTWVEQSELQTWTMSMDGVGETWLMVATVMLVEEQQHQCDWMEKIRSFPPWSC